jgi:hypothetical protein
MKLCFISLIPGKKPWWLVLTATAGTMGVLLLSSCSMSDQFASPRPPMFGIFSDSPRSDHRGFLPFAAQSALAWQQESARDLRQSAITKGKGGKIWRGGRWKGIPSLS